MVAVQRMVSGAVGGRKANPPIRIRETAGVNTLDGVANGGGAGGDEVEDEWEWGEVEVEGARLKISIGKTPAC